MSVLGEFNSNAQRDAELLLTLPLALAPWDAANRVSVFLEAWLSGALLARGMASADVNFAVNELMENAIKYASEGSIELTLGFENSGLRIAISHPVTADRAQRYREIAATLITDDASELFAQIIERNAESANAPSLSAQPGGVSTGAGLGLLSLKMDYQASLAFAFTLDVMGAPHVTTQIWLPSPDSVYVHSLADQATRQMRVADQATRQMRLADQATRQMRLADQATRQMRLAGRRRGKENLQ
jgi:hypothetical protein